MDSIIILILGNINVFNAFSDCILNMFKFINFILQMKDSEIVVFFQFTIKNCKNGTQIKIMGDILMENINCKWRKNYIYYLK